MLNKVNESIKAEILSKVQQGEKSVPQLAKEYGVSDKTIYRWLKEGLDTNPSFWKIKSLERENKDLKELIGALTLEMDKFKKNKGNKTNNRR